MKVAYIKIKQKTEEFFVMRFTAAELKSHLDFHFRNPYTNSQKERITCEEYIEKLQKKGVEINSDNEGVQRRIQLGRINSIKKYLEGTEDSYFPNSVVLAADVSHEQQFMDDVLMNPDLPSVGIIDLPESVNFQIVDGQHRLAGLFISDDLIQASFEIFAVVLFNATKHTCAKVFRDINGNQAPINKSGLFDLLELMEIDENDIETQKERNIHMICKKFNEDPESPLYCHVKMMGIGSGAISQAFFIQRVKKALEKSNIDISDEKQIQHVYTNLYYFFMAFQRLFPEQWPVISEGQYRAGAYDKTFKEKKEYQDVDFRIVREAYSEYIIKEKKSQLLKTNGFGAIMGIFPGAYNYLRVYNLNEYMKYLYPLKDKIDWSNDPILTGGTGDKKINEISEKLRSFLPKEER